MSGDNPTEKKRARQAERLTKLHKQPVSKVTVSDTFEHDNDSVAVAAEPLSAGRAYNPRTLQMAMGIGRSYYNSLMAAGMPHRVKCGRYWFSGSRVIAWLESDDDGDQAS